MFRNVRFYRIGGGWPKAEEEVTQALRAAEFKPCGPLTERSSGWVPVYPDAGDALARRVNGADLIRMRSQSRVLPPSVIKEELEVRIEDYAARMKEAPSASEKRRMKAEARDELMPKAMLRSDRTWGFIDLKENLVGIDALQVSVAERFLRRLGAAIPVSNLRPLQFNQPVGELLTKIFLGNAPRQFAVGRECRMQDAADAGSKVRWSQFDLTEQSIRNHVTDGMRLTHLAIEYDNVLSCVIDQDGTLGKLQFVGMNEDHGDELDPLARLDAEFVLMSGTLRQMIADLKKLLNGFA